MEIWGFSGKLGVGKNYIAERMFQPMLPERKTIFLAFANHFKIDAIVKENLDREKVFGKKDDHTRRVLQIMGTENGRDKYGEDIWINLAEEWRSYYELLGYERAMIFDVRFANEVDYIKRIGGKAIRIEAPQRHLATASKEAELNGSNLDAILTHASENSLNECTSFDLIIKNDLDDNPVIQIRDYLRNYAEENMIDNTFFVDIDDTICECHIYYREVIKKVESLLTPYTAVFEDKGEAIKAAFHVKMKMLQGVVDNKGFVYDRFANDLANSIEFSAKSLDLDQNIVDLLKSTAYEIGVKVYNYPYTALPGAIDAIRDLTNFGKVVLFTLGDRLEQSKKIASLGLSDLSFVVTHDKCMTTFQGLLRDYPAKNHYMIGDNINRDVIPAVQAGIQSVYWIHTFNDKDVDTDDIKPYQVAETLAEAVDNITLTMRSALALRNAMAGMASAMTLSGDLKLMNREDEPTADLYFLDTKMEKGSHISPFGAPLLTDNADGTVTVAGTTVWSKKFGSREVNSDIIPKTINK